MAGIAGAMAMTVRICTTAPCSRNGTRAHITQLRDLRLHGGATAVAGKAQSAQPGRGTYSAWRHILCITTKARWATICGG
jgi:hypothetical protein